MYSPTAVSAPRLVGFSLRAVVWIAESWWGGPLRSKMIRSANVESFDEAKLTEAPLARPRLDWGREFEERAVEGELDRSALLRAPSADLVRRFETVFDFCESYRDGERTPVDVARRVLAATRDSEAREPRMRFFVEQNEQDVLALAEVSARRWKEGTPLSALDGVPIAIKDEVDQVPYPTRVGSKVHGQSPATKDSTVVARLRAAGALLIGKANMHEIGIGVTGLNEHHGTPRNPHDPERFPGGSSSGSAAVVAAGICPAAVAADGGGSIRIPAGLCGVVGLKPTYGRVSEYGAAPLCWSVAHVGPIASTVQDAALLYSYLAGRDANDEATLAQPPPQLRGVDAKDANGLRIGVYRPWFEHAEPEVVARCREALSRLVDAGASLLEIEVPDLALFRAAHLVTIVSEMTASQSPYFARHLRDYGYDARLLFALIRSLPASRYVDAERVRARANTVFRRILSEVDVVATPATGCVAPLIRRDALESGESNLAQTDALIRFAPVPNLTGLPAISFPAGYVEGLPVNLQLIGRPWSEHVLLRLAHVAEQATERRLPKVHYSMLERE